MAVAFSEKKEGGELARPKFNFLFVLNPIWGFPYKKILLLPKGFPSSICSTSFPAPIFQFPFLFLFLLFFYFGLVDFGVKKDVQYASSEKISINWPNSFKMAKEQWKEW
jgi:hypothetical protein